MLEYGEFRSLQPHIQADARVVGEPVMAGAVNGWQGAFTMRRWSSVEVGR